MTPLPIDIYSDIVCPWCFIGTRRLESVIATFGDELVVAVRHHPYELHPDAPPQGIDLREMLARKYRTDPERMFQHVESVARADGIPLDLSKQTRTYDTLGAHTLLRHAHAKGTQRALADALFVAYFLEARNIADAGVLGDVAAAHGFTASEVARLLGDDELAITRDEARKAMTSGIRGVPLFVLDHQSALPGAQPPDAFRSAIEQARVSQREGAKE